jgi:trk system potassium uptake protein
MLTRLIDNLLRRPIQLIPLLFALVSLFGASLLSLPVATEKAVQTPFVDAWFTAISALCVTGLSTLDVPNHWSFFGEAVIVTLIQIGGLGIMSSTVLLIALFSKSMSFSTRLGLSTENLGITAGNARSLLRVIAIFTFSFEGAIALVLTLWFWFSYQMPFPLALWNGVFHSVSAFNNAGFALWSSNLMGSASDWMVLTPIMVAIIAGGIGYPVYHEVWKGRKTRQASLHTRLTLIGYAVLMIVGAVLFVALEYANPATFAALDPHARVLNGLFQSVTSRTAGFNAVDINALTDQSLMLTTILMFIGGGSAGTAGGVKVGTFMVLMLVLWAEIKGRRDVEAFGRRITEAATRRAIAIVVLAALLATGAGYLLVAISPHLAPKKVMFEAVSALATVGLSTGITAQFTDTGKIVLMFLMFAGRVGPITLFAALAFRQKPANYQYPKEDILVG